MNFHTKITHMHSISFRRVQSAWQDNANLIAMQQSLFCCWLPASVKVYWCSPVVCLSFASLSCPSDWFFCASCNTAVDESCWFPLWQPVNTSFCFIFRCLMLRVWLGVLFSCFWENAHCLLWLIPPLIRASRSLCWFKQSCLFSIAWASVFVALCVSRVDASSFLAQWVGLCECYTGTIKTVRATSELSPKYYFQPEWLIRSSVSVWGGCGTKGFSNSLMSSILLVDVEEGKENHMGKIIRYGKELSCRQLFSIFLHVKLWLAASSLYAKLG